MADPKTAAAAAQKANGSGESAFARKRKREEARWQEMAQNKSTWALIGEYVGPWRNGCISPEAPGDATRRSNRIINGAATIAFNSFVAGMLAGNASPSQLWMKVTTRDRKLADGEDEKQYLQDLTDALFEDCANSNAYPALALCFGDEGKYGTAANLMIADKYDPVRCYVFPIGTYALGQDYRGLPNAMSRRFTLTAPQMRDQFGDGKLSAQAKAALESGSEQRFEICHVIEPNEYAKGRASDARFKAWHECYYERGVSPTGEGQYLLEGGYDTFPVVAPRWESAGPHTPYGVGIAIQALGDVVQLQMVTKDEANAVELGVNPALQGPGSLQGAAISRRPGKFTATDVTQGQQKIEPLFPNTLNLSHTQLIVQRLENRIREVFFTDLFKQFTGPVDRLPKTAYLAQKMFLEKVANLLPIMEQQNRELLAPFIERLIQIRIETGRMPPNMPESLANAELTFEFVSPFAEAQRAARTGSMETFLQFWASMAAQLPMFADEIESKVDIYAALEESADGYSLPPKMLRSAEDVADLDEAKAAALEQQQLGASIPGVAKAVKDMGTTPVGTGSALDALAEVGV